MTADRFGNVIDTSVGYARGRLLASSADEIRRLRHAQSLAAKRVAAHGIDAIGIFTGNPRHFPLSAGDLEHYCEEWVGPGLFADELAAAAISHLGGRDDDLVAIFNRTSAAIIAAILALSQGRSVVSFIPKGDRSHASVIRGCALAGIRLVEVGEVKSADILLEQEKPALVIVTTVTSALARLRDEEAQAFLQAARRAGAVTFLDEAYGARLRPVLHAGMKSLQLGADLAVTNADKAGLSGPRAGILVGVKDAVLAVQAKAGELGQEARAPLAAGAMRSLQKFDPEHLRAEASDGAAIADALAARFGADIVRRSDLGPSISEENILDRIVMRGGHNGANLVPAEASAALGMLLLRECGVLTVNTHGAPGGRVSLRLKPTHGALTAVGGTDALVGAIDQAIDVIAEKMNNLRWMSAILFGEDVP